MATIKHRNETTRPDFYFVAAILLTLFALVWLVGHERIRSRRITEPVTKPVSSTLEPTGSSAEFASISRVPQGQFCDCRLAEIELGV